ncbi:MAG TPA: hypothetical protein VKT32_14200 [Chthonomonadaceae bacterium]|nr:hypothetical protein [Chthonomonadaceae bacterium]
MITITVEDMQRDLPGYLKRVSEGETLLIVQADEPIAEVKPVAPVAKQPRPFGLCAGEFTVPDDFDTTLPDDVLVEFEGK